MKGPNIHSSGAIEQQVMASVAVVYGARRFFNPLALKVYALALSTAGIAAFVSLSNVGANFLNVEHNGLFAVGLFVLSAIVSTSLVVQIALVVGTAAFLALLADAARSLRALPHLQGRAV